MIYGAHAASYADAGLPSFPVDTRRKRPAIKGWQGATPAKARHWATIPKLADADGIGVLMGAPSGITEVDVDAAGDSWLAAAIERFGETPIQIRTASGKSKLWYRHSGEGRHIRPIPGLDIDVLGGGFTIAPPSVRADLGAAYGFLTGQLADIDSLPCINPAALTDASDRPAQGVQRGQRNDALWRWCMGQARHCDDVEALMDAAETWASAMPDPLPLAEVRSAAQSAWSYEASGRNYLGTKRPTVTAADAEMDALMHSPDAFALLHLLRRWHSGRASFAIAPRAMSDAGNPPWSWRRIAEARDVLLSQGLLKQVQKPDRGRRRAGAYRLR